MKNLVKFMRPSFALARGVIANRSDNWTYRNSLRCLATACEKSQQNSLLSIAHCDGDRRGSNGYCKSRASVLLGASFAFLGFFEKKTEEEEDPLITTIKRGILLIQKGEFKKAEQMLHVALRQAQSLQNELGITYVYDVMANLAFETGDYDKAEKLFTSVMQRELSGGTAQDDLKIVHISLKMSKILEQKNDFEKAEIGYKYCMKILEDLIDKGTDNDDIYTLWAMNLDWYSHLLLDVSRYSEALKFMEKAYEMCVKINGEIHEQTVVLLNDLGSISFMKNDLDEAIAYLTKAAEIGEKLPNMIDIPSIHINLGNVFIKKGLLDEAKKSCSKGWKMSKSVKNNETLEEAKTCLDEVNKLLST